MRTERDEAKRLRAMRAYWRRRYPDWRLSERQLESLDGLLLGDGALTSYTNRGASLILVGKHEDFVRWTAKTAGNNRGRVSSSERGGKTYWRWDSGHYSSLLKQRQRWYPVGKKVVPQDVRITRRSVLLWWLGDGGLNRAGGPTVVPKIATYGFEISDVDRLGALLEEVTSCPWRRRIERYGPLLSLSAKQARRFFDWLGPSPVEGLAYRWPRENEGVPTWNRGRFKDRDERIVRARQAGATPRDLAEAYSLTPARISQLCKVPWEGG